MRLLVLLVVAGTAHAQPWAEGVSEKDQETAQALYVEANKLFGQEAHAPALEKYAQAIALWDHPVIRFNQAVTLVRLDRFLEAAESLDRSLRFGKDPFPTPDQYRQAVDYQKLIAGRVGEVEVKCSQVGTQITLDAKQLLACPGTKKLRVLAGEHVVVGELAGHMTRSQRVVVTGGKVATVEVELAKIEAVVKYEYPTRRWIPWTVASSGAAIGITGAIVWAIGSNQNDRFKSNFAKQCPNGCDLDDNTALRDQRDSAQFKATFGTVMVIAGSAVAVGGVVWALAFNRARPVQPTVEASPTGANVGVHVRF